MAATPPPAAVPESEGVGLGPDGEKIVDSSYCESHLLTPLQLELQGRAVGARAGATNLERLG